MAGYNRAGGDYGYSGWMTDALEARRKAEYELDKSKADLLTDPEKLDKLAATYYSSISPASQRVKKQTEFITKSDALDAAIPSDHPQKGRPQQFKERMAAAISDSIGYDEQTSDVIGAALGQEMAELGDAPYRYKREKDARLLGLFGGDDSSISKPPLYDEWREEQNRLDDTRFAKEDDILNPAKWAKDLTISAGLGAAVGGLLGAFTAGPAGILPGAAAGAKGFASWELMAKPIRTMLHQGEWHQANAASDSLVDNAQTIAQEFGMELAGGMALAKLFAKAPKALKPDQLLLPYVGSAKIYNRRNPLPAPDITSKPVASNIKRLDYTGVAPGGGEAYGPGGNGESILDELNRLKAKLGDPDAVERFQNLKEVADVAARRNVLPGPTMGLPAPKWATKQAPVVDAGSGAPIRMPFAPEYTLPARVVVPKENPVTAIRNYLEPAFQTPTGRAVAEYVRMNTADRARVDELMPHLGSMEAAVRDVTETRKVKNIVVRLEGRELQQRDWQLAGGQRGWDRHTDELLGAWDDTVTGSAALERNTLHYRQRDEKQAREASSMLGRFGFTIPALSATGVGAVVGGGVLLSDLIAPDEAEAGILSTVIPKMFSGAVKKAASEGKVVDMIKKLGDAGLILKKNANPRMAPDRFQQPLNVAKIAIEKHGSLEDAMIKAGTWIPKVARKIMTAGGLGDLLYKSGSNAAVAMASVEQANIHNTQHMLKEVVPNILQRVKGSTGNTNEVLKATDALAREFVTTAAVYDAARTKADAIEATIEGLKKATKGMKVKEQREFVMSKLDKAQQGHYKKLLDTIEEYGPARKQFLKKVDAVHMDLAQKYAGTRIALAAEDTADFAARPWLKGMMSAEELEATTYVKAIFQRYKGRMVEGNHDVISGPYAHRPLHPAWAEKKNAEMLSELMYMPGESIPFTKFFSRSKSSVQLAPDIEYIMNKYIPDAEKRINWSKFWNSGWKEHAKKVSMFPQHREYWDMVKSLTKPAETTRMNTWANRYYAFEAINLLGGSVSAAAKHAFKLEGTAAAFGLAHTASASPLATMYTGRILREQLHMNPNVSKIATTLGIPKIKEKKLFDELLQSTTATSRYQNVIQEMELDAGLVQRTGFMQRFDKKLQDISSTTGGMIRVVEWWDRAHSVIAATEIAAKKGMTATDAEYMIFDTVLKNNFLGGSLNPLWQKDPLVRAVFMFQNTPFKIMERRLVTAIKAGQGTVRAGRHVWKTTKEQIAALEELQGIGRYVKGAEKAFKAGVLKDAIQLMNAEVGAGGRSFTKQFMSDALFAGAIIAGGGALADADLTGHVAHFPFLKAETEAPVISIAPILTGAYKTLHENGEDDDDFFATRFVHNWLGKKGLIPQQIWKAMRISEDDIPEAYKGSAFKYLFSVPAKSDD